MGHGFGLCPAPSRAALPRPRRPPVGAHDLPAPRHRGDRAKTSADVMTSPILQSKHLTRSFGGVAAIRDVSLEVMDDEIVAIIGPNGAGKTTFFNVISGLIPATSGTVLLAGKPVNGLSPHRIASLGMARTYQNIRLFDSMTAIEN